MASDRPNVREFITQTSREIRFALRRLLQDRWTTVAAVVVSAFASGLTTAVFAFVYGIALRPLPYRDAARLLTLQVDSRLSSIPDWRQQLNTCEQVAGYYRQGFTIRDVGEPRFVPGAVVDDEFFALLGARPLAGRTFGQRDDPAAVVISQRLARTISDSLGEALNRVATIGGVRATIIGIMPEDFGFPADGVDVWIPARAAPQIAFDQSADERRFALVARARSGVSPHDVEENARRAQRLIDPDAAVGANPIDVRSIRATLVDTARSLLLVFTRRSSKGTRDGRWNCLRREICRDGGACRTGRVRPVEGAARRRVVPGSEDARRPDRRCGGVA
jgi:hypothetical protein